MQPFDSANYFHENGKVKMRIWRHGEAEVIDPTPLPYCYTPANRDLGTSARFERPDLRAFDTEESVKRYIFNLPMNVKSFRTYAEGKSVTVYEADKKYVGVWMLDNQFICDDYPNQASWDTEELEADQRNRTSEEIVEQAAEPITAIGIVYKGQRYAWTWNPVTQQGSETSEAGVLQGPVDFINDNKITLLKGWNSRAWDVPYFAKRLAYNHVRFDFSQVRFADVSLAYRFMSKNFRSQWALGKVARRLFDAQKPYVNTRLSTLPDEQLRERVLWDAEYTEKIDSKLEFSRVMIQLAKQGHIFPDQIFGVHPKKQMITITPVLDQYFLQYAHQLGWVLPCKSEYKARPKYPGGLVDILQMGKFLGVLQFDVDSLYPNILIAWKLAPLGKFKLVEPIVRALLDGKRNAKDAIERWAYKIAVNALYGIFASSFYRFHAIEVADGITFHGRDIENHIRDFLRSMGYTVLYLDTDSVFVIGTEDEGPVIQELINDYVRRTYNVDNIKYGLESYWSRIIFPKSAKGEKAKKRYFGIVHTNKKKEVVDEFQEAGMEGLRGDWCDLAKNVQDAIKKFLVTDVPKDKIEGFYEDTKVKLYQGVYDPLLVMEKHYGKDIELYGGFKCKGLWEGTPCGKRFKTLEEWQKHNVEVHMGEAKAQKIGTPQHIKALREAIKTGWVPTDMVQYGVVQYYMTRGAIPKLVNLTQPNEIDYQWYVSHQIDPLLWRLGVIEQVSAYKKEKVQPSNQTVLAT
jgi:DNA polymerase elongation subunit (family B)